MKPRRLHSATTLSIVTTSAGASSGWVGVGGGVSVIGVADRWCLPAIVLEGRAAAMRAARRVGSISAALTPEGAATPLRDVGRAPSYARRGPLPNRFCIGVRPQQRN